MIIKCPECGKDISDKANQCIYCGCPLNNTIAYYSTINGIQYDFTDIIDRIKNASTPAYGCRLITDLLVSSISLKDIKAIYDIIISTGKPPIEYKCEFSPKVEKNQPHCPTCNSTNIEKITIGKKALGGAMFGLFSSDVRNTMHCKNCGAKW